MASLIRMTVVAPTMPGTELLTWFCGVMSACRAAMRARVLPKRSGMSGVGWTEKLPSVRSGCNPAVGPHRTAPNVGVGHTGPILPPDVGADAVAGPQFLRRDPARRPVLDQRE